MNSARARKKVERKALSLERNVAATLGDDAPAGSLRAVAIGGVAAAAGAAIVAVAAAVAAAAAPGDVSVVVVIPVAAVVVVADDDVDDIDEVDELEDPEGGDLAVESSDVLPIVGSIVKATRSANTMVYAVGTIAIGCMRRRGNG